MIYKPLKIYIKIEVDDDNDYFLLIQNYLQHTNH